MYLNRKDLKKIQDVLEKFPEVENFEIEQESGSGIGSITLMTMFTEFNGVKGSFTVEISGVEDW